ncbi:hypothetical protein ABKN59_005648 [Abortiporus biennis]
MTSLPPEICDMIIDIIAFEGLYGPRGFINSVIGTLLDLHSCSLASRTWRTRSQYHIRRHISITGYSQVSCIARISRQLGSKSTGPTRSNFMRSLEICSSFYPSAFASTMDPSEKPYVSCIPVHIPIATLRNIHSLIFDTIDFRQTHPSFLNALTVSMRHVVNLTIKGCIFVTPNDVPKILWAFRRSIKVVILCDIAFKDYIPFDSSRMDMPSAVTPHGIVRIPTCTRDIALETLYLDTVKPAESRDILDWLQKTPTVLSLTSLNIYFSHAVRFATKEDWKWMKSFISQCRALSVLQLKFERDSPILCFETLDLSKNAKLNSLNIELNLKGQGHQDGSPLQFPLHASFSQTSPVLEGDEIFSMQSIIPKLCDLLHTLPSQCSLESISLVFNLRDMENLSWGGLDDVLDDYTRFPHLRSVEMKVMKHPYDEDFDPVSYLAIALPLLFAGQRVKVHIVYLDF